MIPILIKHGYAYQARVVPGEEGYLFIAEDILFTLGFERIPKKGFRSSSYIIDTSWGMEVVSVIDIDTVWQLLSISQLCDDCVDSYASWLKAVETGLDSVVGQRSLYSDDPELLKVRTVSLPQQEHEVKEYNDRMWRNNCNMDDLDDDYDPQCAIGA